MKATLILLTSIAMIVISSCNDRPANSSQQAASPTTLQWPTWVTQGNIYEVNIRQYTDEGTFAAFTEHLPRLESMGVKILWLMPIFPISSTKRKGELGSYYAVSDFRSTNPEFGSMADFDQLVTKAHQLGMKVILDWVPNHTGWDHKWITSHPDYYTKDSTGMITDPINAETGESWGWTDVADLNYDNLQMRQQMIDDLLYWVDEHGIDGYRFDVSHGVPMDFWEVVTPTLMEANPDLFLLSESEIQQHVEDSLFHAIYGWPVHHMMNDIAKGNHNTIDSLHKWISNHQLTAGVHMHFTSNHDENSWAGTTEERMGAGADVFAVLAATLPGIPLVYGGQEEPLKKRLQFFEKDTIGFDKYAKQDFYTMLLQLKTSQPALAAGTGSSSVVDRLPSSKGVYAFTRGAGDDKVVVILNLGDADGEATIPTDLGQLIDYFTGENLSYKAGESIPLKPWEYKIAVRS